MSVTEREVVTVVPSILDPRVERGAALLDDQLPGWEDRIDLDTLDLGSGRCCIRGQIGTSTLFGDESSAFWSEHGWYVEATADPEEQWRVYCELEQDWRLAILSRRQAA